VSVLLSPADPARFRPFVKELFTGLNGPAAPPQRMRMIAVARLALVVPGFYSFALLAQLFALRAHPGAAALRAILVLWLVLLLAYLLTNLAIIGWAKRHPQLSFRLSLIAICIDVTETQLTQGRLGGLLTNFIFAVITVVAYRIALDYASGLIAALSSLVVYFAYVALELGHVIPIAPALDAPPAEYADPGQIASYALQNVTLLVVIFGAVNYGMNQSLKLHRYITQTVLQRYLPPALVARAAAGELRLDEPPTRRLVTVMFMDLVGFTTMSERLGAERVAVVLNRFLTRMTELARESGATVDKFIGDAIMIVFGAPEPMAPEGQALACVALATRVQATMASFDDPPLRVRIGINTGEAVVGHFGSPIRSDFTVIGPAVNVAARLETASAPGRVLVGETTARLLDDAWAKESAGELTLKGVARPVAAYFVTPTTAPPAEGAT
jgi:class 3 adenylate cyclase